MRDFGTYLKLRRKSKMTQRELAKRIGVGFPYISKIENNVEPPPNEALLIKLSKELEIDIDELFLQAGKISSDLKEFLMKEPKAIELLRLVQKENAAPFLLEKFKEFLKKNQDIKSDFLNTPEKMILIIDPETSRIVHANNAAEDFYKYKLEELKELKMTDINTLPPKEIFEEMNKAKLELRNHFFFKHRIRNMEVRDVRVYSSPIEIQGKTYLHSIVYDLEKLSTLKI